MKTLVHNHEICVRISQEVIAGGNLDLADDLVTADFVDHEAPPGTPPGPESVRRLASWLRGAFDDLRYEIQDVFGEDDRVAVRLTLSGTHARPFLGHEGTGRPFSARQIHTFRMADGKVAEHWAVRDDLAMFRQLGFVDA